MKTIRVYTDGSSLNQKYSADETDPLKQRIAGIGVYFPGNEDLNLSELLPFKEHTNNRAELWAAYSAMKIMYDHKQIAENEKLGKFKYKLYTDSQLMINTFFANTNSIYAPFAKGWKQRGWLKGTGEVPENLDIIKPMYQLVLDFQGTLEFVKIKAHQKPPSNEESTEYRDWYGNMMADKLATVATETERERRTQNK